MAVVFRLVFFPVGVTVHFQSLLSCRFCLSLLHTLICIYVSGGIKTTGVLFVWLTNVKCTFPTGISVTTPVERPLLVSMAVKHTPVK